MKFNEKNFVIFSRSILLLFLIFSLEVHSLQGKATQYFNNEQQRIRPDETRGISTKTNMNNYLKQGEIRKVFKNFRFQNKNNYQIPIEEQNEVLMNSQVLDKKPPSDPEEKEEEVFPSSANAGTEFSWGFLFWSFMNYKASNALSGHQSYWLSKRNVQHDHWEAVFDMPQKVDVMEIHWRLAPKRFRIYFKIDDSSEFIPATSVFDKSSFITSQGQLANQEAVSPFNAVVFNKPIFAKRIRINLNEPLRKNSFSIHTVKFFQKTTVIIVKNELLDSCKNYCWYINTSMPREGSSVEAYPCVSALSTATNMELFTYNNDRSLRHYASNLCVGFNDASEVVLRSCPTYNPAFTLQLHGDNSLFFTGYAGNCIYIDDSKKTSPNFISMNTEVIITSQADSQTYKKENIKMEGENFWHSAPGQHKVTMQIFFGKTPSGQFEIKKIDTIKIEWIKEPKKFMIYTWKPGNSWILRGVYNNFKGKKSEITLIGQTSAALMIVLDKSHDYSELGGVPAYAMKEIYIGYNGMKVKTTACASKINKYKIFDFDQQSYVKTESTAPYVQEESKISISFEQEVNAYKNIKLMSKYVAKVREKANDFITKLNTVKNAVGSSTIKKLSKFKSESLPKFKNARMEHYVKEKKEHSFVSATTKQFSGTPKIGTKSMPAEDCLQIKKLRKTVLSGFYMIKPECSPKPIRVFCDFTVYADAVDFYIFNNYADEPNPDLTYLGIKDHTDVRYQCAKVGLLPIELNNAEMVSRISQILTAVGYDLSKPIAIPLGYDYTCKNGKCSNMINSLNDPASPPIMTFFKDPFKSSSNLTKPGPFAGLGFSENPKMVSFNADSTIISGVVCSTNHFQSDANDDSTKSISCEMNAASNGDIFEEGSDVLVKCPASCQQSSSDVYGAGLYHANSAVCVAAVHSGALPIQGGKINVRLQKGLPQYQGSFANGVKSKDYNKNDGQSAFVINKFTPKCPIDNFPEKLAEIELEKENSSFIEMENFEENFINAQKSKNLKFDPKELEGIDIEELTNAGLVFSKKGDLDKEDSDYNKSHDNNNGNNFKFAQVELENTFNIPQPGDPVALAAANDTPAPGSPGTQPGINNNLPNSPNTPAQPNIPNLGNTPGLANLANLSNNLNSLLPQSGNSGVPGLRAGPGAPIGSPQSPSDPTSSPFAPTQADSPANITSDTNLPNVNDPNGIGGSGGSGGVGGSGSGAPGSPMPPPTGPNAAPPQAPIQPESQQEEKKPTDNKRCQPITDGGIMEVKDIRKSHDWEHLTDLSKKHETIKAEIGEFSKNMAWSGSTSKLSCKKITEQYHAIASFKNKVQANMRALEDQAHARVDRTKKLKIKWNDECGKLTENDPAKIDYSKSKVKLLHKDFQIDDVKCDTKSNWDVHTKDIKGRSKAIGITSAIFSTKQPAASIMKFNQKNFYDCTISVDILVRASGKAGIVFRMSDQFNYYAFMINKHEGYKAIIKVENGREIILKKIKDGGILINDWHNVNIVVQASSIRVEIYDTEMMNKSLSEKILEATDHTFVRGTVGVFVNKMEGFFYDNLSVKPISCWTPWEPIRDLNIFTVNASVLIEDFTGSIKDKFDELAIGEGEKDGPAEWAMNVGDIPGIPNGVCQKSIVYDSSAANRPTMMIYKDKTLTNGVLQMCMTPQKPEGMVSVIFKYSKEVNTTGNLSERFYIFDLIHSSTDARFTFRKFNDGVFKELKTSDVAIAGLESLGYIPDKNVCVVVEAIGSKISIKVSVNESQMVEVFTIKEDSIRSGSVGFGTFKTEANVYKVELFPPQLELSEADKNYLLKSDTPGIPIPDVTSIRKAANSSNAKDSRNIGSSDALGNLIAKATTLGSTLGLNFSNAVSDTANAVTSIIAKNDPTKKSNLTTGWKVCVTSRTNDQRNGYCERRFDNKSSVKSCQTSFCDTCCNTNVFSDHKNVLHLCKKTCYRSLLAENTNEDYKNTCINSQNPMQNIYAYCSSRMRNYDETLMKFCKLDMCNLCCVTMDPMKKKNYSLDNLKGCFKECSKKFNNEDD